MSVCVCVCEFVCVCVYVRVFTCVTTCMVVIALRRLVSSLEQAHTHTHKCARTQTES